MMRKKKIEYDYYQVIIHLDNQSFHPDSWGKVFETKSLELATDFVERFMKTFGDIYERGDVQIYGHEKPTR